MQPQPHLADFAGVLQADAYGSVNAIYETGAWLKQRAGRIPGANFTICMSYMRR